MKDYATSGLRAALASLVRHRNAKSLAQYLDKHRQAIDKELQQTVLADIPAFTDSGNPEVQPQLARHGAQHTAEIIRLLNGGSLQDFDFVREHAERRAEQRFPLEATLHAYRCGHKIYLRWLRVALAEALPDADSSQRPMAEIADFTMEYTDTISTVATGHYLSRVRLLADVAGDERAELVSILLDGYDESDGRVANVLRRAGYLDGRKAFCVALAQSVDPSEMLNPARARRMADAIDKTLQDAPGCRHIDLRNNRVIMIFADARRASGWTTEKSSLAKRLVPKLMMVGNAALIGISNDVPSTSKVPAAYREALLALEMADVGNRVISFADLPLQRLMVRFAAEQLQPVLPAWANTLQAADKNGLLIETLRAYAEADMNALKAAELLRIHPNTIYARFQRIEDITGLLPKTFNDLNELLIAADCQTMRV